MAAAPSTAAPAADAARVMEHNYSRFTESRSVTNVYHFPPYASLRWKKGRMRRYRKVKNQKAGESELQVEVMQEEMAAIKMKAEEYEVARDKELELLCKKSQEQDEKLAHLMALFGAKAS
ncbi:hypothetical protein D1007_01482 [Hordeum vulgare]|nr:hypothetical protein D1007_01482 [Hordeum vulgare]